MLHAQTFSQYLATLGGAASKQTSLQSTLQGQNIAGLYKQQTTDDRFKVGSPSGSVYWTAGAYGYMPFAIFSLSCKLSSHTLCLAFPTAESSHATRKRQ